MAEPDNRERIATLEAEIRHLKDAIDRMASKVDETHEVLLQARGAKWAILGFAGITGFLGGKGGGILLSMLGVK